MAQKPTSQLHTSASTVPRRTIIIICPKCGIGAPLVLHKDGMIGIEKHYLCDFAILSLNHHNGEKVVTVEFRVKTHG